MMRLPELLMHYFASLIRCVAKRLLSREWEQLSRSVDRLRAESLLESSNCPAWIAQALLLSGEDHRFFTHGGIDVFAVCRAAWRRVVWGRREGASTIEMQLVRVLTGRFERTLVRKIREAGLATLLAASVPKSELPVLYLRVGYYGTHMVGYSRACTRLGYTSHSMTPRQAAALVARLKYPEPATPSDRVTALIRQRTTHLLRLHRQHLETRAYYGLLGRVDYAAI
jgi:membrane carboxypeptidase/penicillin-binding protein PbpC